MNIYLNRNIFSKSSNNNHYNCLKEKIEKNILFQFNSRKKNIDLFIEKFVKTYKLIYDSLNFLLIIL